MQTSPAVRSLARSLPSRACRSQTDTPGTATTTETGSGGSGDTVVFSKPVQSSMEDLAGRTSVCSASRNQLGFLPVAFLTPRVFVHAE